MEQVGQVVSGHRQIRVRPARGGGRRRSKERLAAGFEPTIQVFGSGG